jgi:hypothetical protein
VDGVAVAPGTRSSFWLTKFPTAQRLGLFRIVSFVSFHVSSFRVAKKWTQTKACQNGFVVSRRFLPKLVHDTSM